MMREWVGGCVIWLTDGTSYLSMGLLDMESIAALNIN